MHPHHGAPIVTIAFARSTGAMRMGGFGFDGSVSVAVETYVFVGI